MAMYASAKAAENPIAMNRERTSSVGTSTYRSGRRRTPAIAADQFGVGQRLGSGQRHTLPIEFVSQQRPRSNGADVGSTMGALDADAYGPAMTSPARSCRAHMPAKLVANTDGRRLTQDMPEPTASCSVSLLRSPRNRDGWREKSSSTLIADSATTFDTPSARARATTSGQLGSQRS